MSIEIHILGRKGTKTFMRMTHTNFKVVVPLEREGTEKDKLYMLFI